MSDSDDPRPLTDAYGGLILPRRSAEPAAAPRADEPTASPAQATAPTTAPAAPRGRAEAPTTARPRARSERADVAQARASAIARRKALARERWAQQQRGEELAAADDAIDDPSGLPAVVRQPSNAPRPRRRPPRFLRVHVAQVMIWQAAIAAVLAVHRQPASVLVPVVIASALAVLITAVPVGGRWLYEWIALRVRYAARRRVFDLADGQDAQRLIGPVARGGSIEALEVHDRPVAMISHAVGYTAVLEIEPHQAEQVRAVPSALPSLAEILPSREPGEPEVSAQIITHWVPSPSLLAKQDAAAGSYQELGEGVFPSTRRAWIAIQVLHTPEGFLDAQMRAALANAVMRLERRLTKLGLRSKTLTESDLASDLRSLYQFGIGAWTGAGRSEERWDGWVIGDVRHVTFRLLNWPRIDDYAQDNLFQRLNVIPALSTTVEYGGKRFGNRIDLEVALRFAVADPQSAAAISKAVTALAREEGAAVQRLDGEHVFGMAASLPLGGFAA